MIKLKNLINERYTAIVLDDSSRNELIQMFQNIPDGWEIVAHHMTIDPFKDNADERIGQKVIFQATDVGISDKAIAIKVVGYDRTTNNAFPHITVAINRNNGGKPKDSNVIQNWEKIKGKIQLQGTIQNVN